MNVSELYQLTTWIENSNQDNIIQNNYQNLINAFYNEGAFGQEKESLFATLKDIAFEELSGEQISFLKKINLTENLGLSAIEKIEDVLFINAIDRETAVQKISEMSEKVKTGIDKLNSIKANLSGLIDEEQYELDNEVLMRVGFMGSVSMNNVEDLKKLGTLWFDIGRGISMAQGKSPKDIKIIGATKGSVILELILDVTLVKIFMSIVKEGLTVTEKVYRIKKLKAEAKLAEMKLDHFDEKIQEVTDDAITNISNKLFKELKLNTGNQGDKKIALEKSIIKLVNFTKEGGDIDFVIKEKSEEEDDKTKLLRKQVIEIKNLEEKILLLEDKNGTD